MIAKINFLENSDDLCENSDNYIYNIEAKDLAESGFADIDLSIGINAQYSNNITISNNTFGAIDGPTTDVIAAISQTWVGEVVIEDNLYNNVVLFYVVDEYSYESSNNVILNTDSFGLYVQSSFTISSEDLPAPVQTLGWFSNIDDAINIADEETQVFFT